MPALHLAQRPQELPKDSDFERRDTPVPALADGQVHVKVSYILRGVYTGKNFGKQLVQL